MNEITLYRFGDSFFHHLDSRIKLFILLAVSIIVYLFKNPVVPGICFLICLIMDWIALKEYAFKNMLFKMILVMAFFLLILHGFVNPEASVPASFFGKQLTLPFLGTYKIDGFYLGLVFWLRMSAIILCAMMFVTTTSPAELINGLMKLGVPFKFCFMLSMSLQLIPVASREAIIIASAQRARGLPEKTIVDRFKGLLPMFVPLVVSSIDRMETMSMALESRAFGYNEHPTSIDEVQIRNIDRILLIVCALLLVGCIFLRIRYGTMDWISTVQTWKDIFIPGRL